MESHELAPLILIVEDNLTNARLTGGMLEAVGFRVAFATDGDEGLSGGSRAWARLGRHRSANAATGWPVALAAP